MKLSQTLNKHKFFFVIIFFIFILSLIKDVYANNEDIKNITSKLRCMTCQNQSIHDSDADFSKDIKKLIKEKLQNNETEKEIINFLIDRYGEYIVFEPQLNKRNIFLWLFPFVFMAISLVFLVFRMKKANK
tara:strand:+ start:5243 stop:5635 length:393 start_codon:yes stop_codon:yes gene_type:complete